LQRKPSSDDELLLLSTIALEQALESQDWNEWEALIRSRDALIARVEKGGIDPDLLVQIKAADDRLAALLREKRENLVSELTQTLNGARKARLFSQTSQGNNVGNF
jgi:hypothetical protein